MQQQNYLGNFQHYKKGQQIISRWTRFVHVIAPKQTVPILEQLSM